MNFTDPEWPSTGWSLSDLLLGEASGSPGEVGKPALWRGELDECAFQNTLLRVRSRTMEPSYLLHYFRFVALTGGFRRRVPRSWHSGPRAAGPLANSVPSLGEQRIVAILEEHFASLDALPTVHSPAPPCGQTRW